MNFLDEYFYMLKLFSFLIEFELPIAMAPIKVEKFEDLLDK